MSKYTESELLENRLVKELDVLWEIHGIRKFEDLLVPFEYLLKEKYRKITDFEFYKSDIEGEENKKCLIEYIKDIKKRLINQRYSTNLSVSYLKVMLDNLKFVYLYYLLEEISNLGEKIKKQTGSTNFNRIEKVLKEVLIKENITYIDIEGEHKKVYDEIFVNKKNSSKDKSVHGFFTNFKKSNTYLSLKFHPSFCVALTKCLKLIEADALAPYRDLLKLIRDTKEKLMVEKHLKEINREYKLGFWEIAVERISNMKGGLQEINKQMFYSVASNYITEPWVKIREGSVPKGLTALAYESALPVCIVAKEHNEIKYLEPNCLCDTWSKIPISCEYWNLNDDNNTKTMVIIPMFLKSKLTNCLLLKNLEDVDVFIPFGFASFEFDVFFKITENSSLGDIFLDIGKIISKNLIG